MPKSPERRSYTAEEFRKKIEAKDPEEMAAYGERMRRKKELEDKIKNSEKAMEALEALKGKSRSGGKRHEKAIAKKEAALDSMREELMRLEVEDTKTEGIERTDQRRRGKMGAAAMLGQESEQEEELRREIAGIRSEEDRMADRGAAAMAGQETGEQRQIDEQMAGMQIPEPAKVIPIRKKKRRWAGLRRAAAILTAVGTLFGGGKTALEAGPPQITEKGKTPATKKTTGEEDLGQAKDDLIKSKRTETADDRQEAEKREATETEKGRKKEQKEIYFEGEKFKEIFATYEIPKYKKGEREGTFFGTMEKLVDQASQNPESKLKLIKLIKEKYPKLEKIKNEKKFFKQARILIARDRGYKDLGRKFSETIHPGDVAVAGIGVGMDDELKIHIAGATTHEEKTRGAKTKKQKTEETAIGKQYKQLTAQERGKERFEIPPGQSTTKEEFTPEEELADSDTKVKKKSIWKRLFSRR